MQNKCYYEMSSKAPQQKTIGSFFSSIQFDFDSDQCNTCQFCIVHQLRRQV